MARVAGRRISIFRLRVSFQAYIPNAVDYERYGRPLRPPHTPVALVSTRVYKHTPAEGKAVWERITAG